MEVIRCFPEFMYAEVAKLLQISQRPLLSTFFPIHISLITAKDSRNRPGVVQRVPGGLGSQIFMTFDT